MLRTKNKVLENILIQMVLFSKASGTMVSNTVKAYFSMLNPKRSAKAGGSEAI